jgi:hypothetical protein
MHTDPFTLSSDSRAKFSAARWQVFIGSIIKALRGQSNGLLPFETIRSELRLRHARELGLQDIELDKIVGSVGRYDDFTREFLPLRDSDEGRWRRVYDLTESTIGVPAIDVFKAGDVYFVRDGNHRVSVARTNGLNVIEAYVTEYVSPITLTAEDTLDDILIRLGHTNFIETTGLDQLRPEHQIQLTNPGRYRLLLEHIAVHKYLREVELSTEIDYEEAVTSWYDHVYLPLIEEMRERQILDLFPGRTEADLYAWLVLHRAELEQEYGLGYVSTAAVVGALVEQSSPSPLKWLERTLKRVLHPAEASPLS